MKYYEIDTNSKIIIVQPNKEDGLKEDPTDSVVCGMIDNGDGTFSLPIKSQAEIALEEFNNKWKIVDNYMSNLEITSDISVGGNKFNASPQGLINIQNAIKGMDNNSTKKWVEEWGTFTTNLVEMDWILIEAQRLKDLKIIEVGLV